MSSLQEEISTIYLNLEEESTVNLAIVAGNYPEHIFVHSKNGRFRNIPYLFNKLEVLSDICTHFELLSEEFPAIKRTDGTPGMIISCEHVFHGQHLLYT